MPWLAALLVLLCAGTAAAQELVHFPARDADLTGGKATDLTAYLYRPAGPGPFPAVVMHHGCGGMYGRTGAPSPHTTAWARHFTERGYIALAVDSFTSRGYAEMCTRPAPQPVRMGLERPRDGAGALRYLQSRPDVIADRIADIGWSHGGGTVLFAASRLAASLRGQVAGPDFRTMIAFYPPCALPLANERYAVSLPVLILIGEVDDWTPAPPCVALADHLKRKGEPVDLVLYADAHHGFDGPGDVRFTRGDAAAAVARGGVVTMATDPAARADAIARVDAWLDRHLRAP